MNIFEIAIVGVVASLLMETIQKAFGTGTLASKSIMVGISLVFGTVYVMARDSGWWEAFITILGVASTVYAFILKK
jgi:hypothetical protein